MEKPLNLIILGPQGSGKGTQAALLQKRFDAAYFGAGDALREIAKTDTALGRKVHQTINVEGKLVEPELISEVVREKILTVPREQNLVIDSYPRSLEQYELFRQFLSDMNRGPYTVVFLELSEEAVRQRLALFNSLTLPMIRQMEMADEVICVNGLPSIEQVHQEILAKLK